MTSHLTVVFTLFLFNCHEWCQTGVQFYSFACKYAVFQALFNEETVSPPSVPDCLIKYLLTLYAWVYIWILSSISLLCMPFYMTVPYYLPYYSFIILFDIMECDTSRFVVLSHDRIAYTSSFVVPHTFLFFFFYFKKCHWVLIGIALNPQMTLDSMNIQKILILPIMNKG